MSGWWGLAEPDYSYWIRGFLADLFGYGDSGHTEQAGRYSESDQQGDLHWQDESTHCDWDGRSRIREWRGAAAPTWRESCKPSSALSLGRISGSADLDQGNYDFPCLNLRIDTYHKSWNLPCKILFWREISPVTTEYLLYYLQDVHWSAGVVWFKCNRRIINSWSLLDIHCIPGDHKRYG